MASKSAADITAVTIDLRMPCKKHVHTITVDNSREVSYLKR
ncbi:hypothetical protein BTN49_0103 [Candidatus Enterovibrio escicola]|uniref:Uncharacterized protein n=1 Tax=Candidatus Enterovibrio escicola TaxID=1927127 RepID=A0A2A5T7B3_9GAMM|nr:hypothetical protein BTN49_0103 [Candidatus Enterovibrio escacola]